MPDRVSSAVEVAEAIAPKVEPWVSDVASAAYRQLRASVANEHGTVETNAP